MEGGTTFHFIVEGFDIAFERAKAAASDLGVGIAGDACTVRQAFPAGVIDDLMLDVAPVLLGAIHSPRATHVHYRIAAD